MLRCTFVGNRSKLKDQLLANDSFLCWGKNMPKNQQISLNLICLKKGKEKKKGEKTP